MIGIGAFHAKSTPSQEEAPFTINMFLVIIFPRGHKKRYNFS